VVLVLGPVGEFVVAADQLVADLLDRVDVAVSVLPASRR
jgi:hypothetical protein